jgi:hypothetical protein
MSKLCLHAGAFNVTREQVAQVHTPEGTDTWYPIPHETLIDQTIGQLEAAGLQIESEMHGLTPSGERYFGVFNLIGNDGASASDDYQLSVGLRNSHDQSIVAGLSLGTRVFVCDNLAFSGEVTLARRHTRFIERDLPNLMAGAIEKVVSRGPAMRNRIQQYKDSHMLKKDAHDIIVRALDARVISAPRIADVLQNWREPNHEEFRPRTGWSLFNAFTETLKRYEPHSMAKRSNALYGLFDLACGVSVN